MPFKRRFKDKYAGSLPENASVVRTLFDLFLIDASFHRDYHEHKSCTELKRRKDGGNQLTFPQAEEVFLCIELLLKK